MSGNDMRNVELPIILTSLVLDYSYWVDSRTSLRLVNMEVDCSLDISDSAHPDVCIIKRVV